MKLSSETKRQVAAAVIYEAEPGYHGNGSHYAVDLDGDGYADAVMFRQTNSPWNPWHDKATAIGVDRFSDPETDYDCPPDMENDDCVDFALDTIRDEASEED